MTSEITKIQIKKIKNSKNEPTVEVEVWTGRVSGKASAPSGTSVGKYEVKAFPKKIESLISFVKKEFSKKLIGFDVFDQKNLDSILSKNIGKIGGAISVATSIAVSKAAAKLEGLELFQYLGKRRKYVLPTPIGKCIGGGAHAKSSTNIQEFLSIPFGTEVFKEKVGINEKIHQKVRRLLHEKLGKYKEEKDLEGGWVADITDDFALQVLSEAVSDLGWVAYIGVDVAATNLYRNGNYFYGNHKKNNEQQFDYIEDIIRNFHVFYMEDPFDQDDFESHRRLTKEFDRDCLIVGDDLFATNPKRLKKGIKLKACNSIIIKPNQVGTLTDCYKTVDLAKKNNYVPIISHRSGETLDNTISHLAVGWGIPYIKTGIVGKERTAKTDELIRIEKKVS